MPNAARLQILVDLRRQVQPRLSQSAVARKFDLDHRYGRKAVSAWESGENIPSPERRARFIGYLWDDLGLRKTPERFEELWQLLVEEWKWDPISDDEWQQHFPGVPRTKLAQSTLPELQLPLTEPSQVPTQKYFVGRATELAEYQRVLTESGMVFICGLVGVGKTTVAARLAQLVSAPDQTFWHVCYERDSIDTIIWKLAEFLAWHNYTDLWFLLQNGLHTGIAQPKGVLLDYLCQQLRGKQYLLCFDDFHFVMEEALQQGLIARLQQGAANGDFKLFVTSTAQITALGGTPINHPLAGLSLDALYQLLAQRQVSISDAIVKDLHARTEGNAELLMLTIQLLQQEADPETLLKRLVKVHQVKQFLLEAVHRRLCADEPAVMSGVAVLMNYPGTVEVVEALIQGVDELTLTLTRLSARHLVREVYESTNQFDPAYIQPTIIQAFYYELLPRQKRRELHLLAGAYYEKQPQEIFLAALHYFYAGNEAVAVTLVAQHVRSQLAQGRVYKLQWVLTQIDRNRLSDELQIQIAVAMGQIHSYLQQLAEALAAFEGAFAQLDTLPQWCKAQEYHIRICREIGFLLRNVDPAKALQWLQLGVAALTENSADDSHADLMIQLGNVYLRTGEYQAAYHSFKDALAQLPKTPNLLRLLALMGLGKYHFYQGHLGQSQKHFQAAAQMAQILRDPINELAIYINLAAICQVTGNWGEAFANYAKAEPLADRLGKVRDTVLVLLNSGVLYLHQGDHQEARLRLSAALSAARQGSITESMITALGYLAEAALTADDQASANTHLAEAWSLMDKRPIRYLLPFLCDVQAFFCAKVDALAAAIRYAQQSLAEAQQQGMKQEEGIALRRLAELAIEQGQPEVAMNYFSESLTCLSGNPFESARTQASWGHQLMQSNQPAAGRELLQRAQITFFNLGASSALAQVENLSPQVVAE